MFEQSLVETTHHTSRAKPLSMVAALLLQLVVLLLFIVVPLLITETLPQGHRVVETPITAGSSFEQHSAPRHSRGFVRSAPRFHPTQTIEAPSVIPGQIAHVMDESAPSAFPTIGINTLGAPGRIPGALGTANPPLPPAPARVRQRIRLGGQVEAANCLNCDQNQPVYPPIAVQAHIEGHVLLHAVIGKDGRIEIQSLRLVSGPPLLAKAAMQAVERWRYRPTLLNGTPVEVETQIDVNFTIPR